MIALAKLIIHVSFFFVCVAKNEMCLAIFTDYFYLMHLLFFREQGSPTFPISRRSCLFILQ